MNHHQNLRRSDRTQPHTLRSAREPLEGSGSGFKGGSCSCCQKLKSISTPTAASWSCREICFYHVMPFANTMQSSILPSALSRCYVYIMTRAHYHMHVIPCYSTDFRMCVINAPLHVFTHSMMQLVGIFTQFKLKSKSRHVISVPRLFVSSLEHSKRICNIATAITAAVKRNYAMLSR